MTDVSLSEDQARDDHGRFASEGGGGDPKQEVSDFKNELKALGHDLSGVMDEEDAKQLVDEAKSDPHGQALYGVPGGGSIYISHAGAQELLKEVRGYTVEEKLELARTRHDTGKYATETPDNQLAHGAREGAKVTRTKAEELKQKVMERAYPAMTADAGEQERDDHGRFASGGGGGDAGDKSFTGPPTAEQNKTMSADKELKSFMPGSTIFTSPGLKFPLGKVSKLSDDGLKALHESAKYQSNKYDTPQSARNQANARLDKAEAEMKSRGMDLPGRGIVNIPQGH